MKSVTVGGYYAILQSTKSEFPLTQDDLQFQPKALYSLTYQSLLFNLGFLAELHTTGEVTRTALPAHEPRGLVGNKLGYDRVGRMSHFKTSSSQELS